MATLNISPVPQNGDDGYTMVARAAVAAISMPGFAGVTLWDTIKRGDTTAGSLGAADSGGTWSIRESGGPAIRVSNGQIRGTIGVVSYWYQTTAKNVTAMGANIRFGPGNGGSLNNAAYGLAVGPGALYAGDDVLIENIIHCIITRTYCIIQVRGKRVTGQAFYTVARRQFASTIPNDLTPVRVELVIQGSRAVLTVGNESCEAFDQRIEQLAGNKPYWEHYYASGSGDEELFTDSIWACTGQRIVEAGPVAMGGQECVTTSSVQFPNAASYATANLTTLTAPNTQSFTVWTRVVVPRKPLTTSTGYLWLLNGSSTGASTTPKALGYIDNADNLVWWIQDASGTSYWVVTEFANRYGGQTVDLFFVFDRDANTFKCFADGTELWVNTGSAGTPPTPQSITLASSYLTLGNQSAANPFSGGLKLAGLLNFAMSREDMLLGHRNFDQYRWQWSTNATLAAGSMAAGKVYRLVAVATANFFYSGCAVGDRILFLGGTSAILLSTTNSADGRAPGATVVVSSSTFNATNTGRQEGFMCLLDGTMGIGNRLIDLSTNMCDAIGSGGLAHSLPVPRARSMVPSMTKAQRNAIATPDNGTIVRVTDGTDRLSWYVAGAWVTPTVAADP